MNRVSIAGVLGALLFVIPSCGASDSAAGSYGLDIVPTIEGIIASQSSDAELPAEARTMMETALKSTFEGMSFELMDDNTFTATAPVSGSTKGTWSEASGNVTLNTTHEDGKEMASTQTGTYKDGALIVESEREGQKITLFFKKQTK